jgi:serine protease Do
MPNGQAPQRAPKEQVTGSGFFISADGYIVTNNHVVEGATKITVRMADKRRLDAHLVGRDPATDLAVIKVDGGDFSYVSFEDRAKPRVGDWVVAVGNPYDLGGTATAGIVSALGRENVSGSSFVDYMQIDAPINRGNSGGPTFDTAGRVVGVNSAIYSPTGGSVGIGFAIPADVAQTVTRQLVAHGKVTRGYIGATIQDITPDIAASLGVSPSQGALVADVTPDGPSARAGLRAGDVIEEVDGQTVASASGLTQKVALAEVGQGVRLQVLRDGHATEVTVRAGLRPSEAQLAAGVRGSGGDDQGEGGPAAAPTVLGMQLGRLSDQTRQQFGLADQSRGVVVEGVRPDSDAQEKGLQPGDVIVKAGERSVSSPTDVSAAAAEARRNHRSEMLLLVARNGQNIFVPLAVAGAQG